MDTKTTPGTAVYNPIGSADAGYYNAIGYDTADNYIYGIQEFSNPPTDTTYSDHLIRIASDGTVTDLGLPVGLPSTIDIYAGDMIGNTLYVRTDANTIYAIDVTTVTAAPITFTGSGANVSDIVAIGNNLYGALDNNLYDYNLTTLTATTTYVSGLDPTGAYGAGWTDSNNDLFFSDNAGSNIYQITGYTTSSPSASVVINNGLVFNHGIDGASCPTVSAKSLDMDSSHRRKGWGTGQTQWDCDKTRE